MFRCCINKYFVKIKHLTSNIISRKMRGDSDIFSIYVSHIRVSKDAYSICFDYYIWMGLTSGVKIFSYSYCLDFTWFHYSLKSLHCLSGITQQETWLQFQLLNSFSLFIFAIWYWTRDIFWQIISMWSI